MTTPASDASVEGTPGTPVLPVEGAVAGTQAAPEGFVSRAELEREQVRSRAFQGEKDRLAAQLAAQAAPIAPVAAAASGEKPLTASEVGQVVFAAQMKAAQMVAQVASLREKFPRALGSIFESAMTFETPEAFVFAVSESHNEIDAVVKREAAAEVDAVKADFAKRFGQAALTPSGEGSAPVPGELTLAQIAKMSLREQAEYDKAHPGLVDRLLRSAT